jgi:hypothetical protein
VDSFQTNAAQTFVNSFSLPAGFFGNVGGVSSDPVTTPSMMHFGGVGGSCMVVPLNVGVIVPPPGGEFGTGEVHGFAPVTGIVNCDTQVQRQADASFPNIGNSATIPLQIQSLSLKSVSPLAVTYGGGSTNFFDVFIGLTPGPEPIGSAVLTRTGDWTGIFNSVVPVQYRITFTNENPLGPAAATPLDRSDSLSASNGTFTVTPEPDYLPFVIGFLGFSTYTVRSQRRRKSGQSPIR